MISLYFDALPDVSVAGPTAPIVDGPSLRGGSLEALHVQYSLCSLCRDKPFLFSLYASLGDEIGRCGQI
jgi:hypothetical protein